jgi:glycosyltransferase involved in cell wall biosynthesis
MQVLLTTTRAWYLDKTAQALSRRQALAGLWMADKNATNLPAPEYVRCWPYHLVMKPFYHWTSQIWSERATYFFQPVYEHWLRRRLRAADCPKFQVVHAITGVCTEAFNRADEIGALKVADCANSHPTTLYGYWQRECDLWCPGENVPLPRSTFRKMNQELERADLVLCPSTFVRDTMVQNGIPGEKCFISPFGVDTSVFQPRATPPAQPRFVCVGTICLRKGHQYLFRAFERVKAQLPQAELVCVGEVKCDFRREWPQWQHTIQHYERMAHGELAQLLQTATAFVFPSLEEGFARVLAEAMGAGLPIIATHESGATTLIRDGEQGFVVPGRRIEPLAEAMIKVATNPELNERMGRAAHEVGARRNTWQDYGDRLLAEYERRLTQKKL